MTGAAVLLAMLALFVALSAIMALGWIAEQRTGNAGWIDATWTFGLGATGAAAAALPLSDAWPTERQLVVIGLVLLWSLRLGTHIVGRNRRNADDPRYAELRRGYGDEARSGMFWLCQKQAWVTVPLALSIMLAAQNPVPGFRPLDWLALAVLAVAIAGEGLADSQLQCFTANPTNRGRVCDVGLWRWSRHPNYFFEWLGWCAYPLFAIDLSGSHPFGWLALIGPLCMYWLLAHVSGVPPLESHMLRTRGEAFRAYQRRTSAFFPLPPKPAI